MTHLWKSPLISHTWINMRWNSESNSFSVELLQLQGTVQSGTSQPANSSLMCTTASYQQPPTSNQHWVKKYNIWPKKIKNTLQKQATIPPQQVMGSSCSDQHQYAVDNNQLAKQWNSIISGSWPNGDWSDISDKQCTNASTSSYATIRSKLRSEI